MSSPRIRLAVVAVVVALVVVTGAALAEKVNLTFTAWGGISHKEIYERLADVFNKSHPDIHIEFLHWEHDYVDKMKTSIMGGVGPDIYFCQEMQTVGFIKDGWFMPLNRYMETDPEWDRSQIFEGMFDCFTWQGQIGAVPVVTFVSMLFYNPVLFEEAGLPRPESMTWDDLVRIGKILTKKDSDGRVTQYGHRVEWWPNFYVYYLWQNGGGILDESLRKAILNSPETIEAVEFMHDLAWTYEIAPKPSEMGEFLLEKGNLGMFTHGSWMIGYYRNQFEFADFGAIPTPAGKEDVGLAYPNGFGISSASKHPDEAWEFIKFASGPEGQKVLAEAGLGIPINKAPEVRDAYVVGPTAEQRMAAVMALAKAHGPRVVPGTQGVIIDRLVGPPLNRVWANEASPVQVLEEAQRQVQDYLDSIFAEE